MNHLNDEKSPYLIQHRENLVDWYPWSEEAFNKARIENKPVFLSIGYSTCHWCHVMEKQSFNDSEVAQLMNDNFVNIKVDREEYPDIDQIYMGVCITLNGTGGWPLSIIMTPDRKPFFAATFIPKTGSGRKRGMIELIPIIRNIWKSEHNTCLEFAEKVVETLENDRTGDFENDREYLIKNIFTVNTESFERSYDVKYGGFGFRPKFPSAHNFLFLLNQYYRTSKIKYLEMVLFTLKQLRSGGIFDHVGFGFHRYSTDEQWKIPHFEKMIYDQAMLIISYTEAYTITRNNFYKDTAKEIIEYVRRDMTSTEGSFFSAEDADTEGVEGKFYQWSFNEISEVLNITEQSIITGFYNIKKEGNFIDESTGRYTGGNILYTRPEFFENAKFKETQHLKQILHKLFIRRKERIHPFKDDKILTNWNGLMIAALSKASAAFHDNICYKTAVKSAVFISNKLMNSNTQLHRYRENESAIEANLEDYSFFIYGLINLYQARFEVRWLAKSIELARIMVARFYDHEHGGFYFTTKEYADRNKLIIRPKDLHDGALPSGNSMALMCLILLDKLSGHPVWTREINKTVSYYLTEMQNYPTGYSFFLTALDLHLNSGFELIVNGKKDNLEARKCVKFVRDMYMPGLTIHQRNPENYKDLESIVEYTVHMGSPSETSFYICENNQCQPPMKSLSQVVEFFKKQGFNFAKSSF